MTDIALYTPHLLAMGVSFAAALISGCMGFGSALLAMPLLTLFLDIKASVALCVLQGVTLSSLLTLHLWRHVRLSRVAPLAAGALPGAVLGLYFLKSVDAAVLETGLGVLLISFSVYTLCCRPRLLRVSPLWGVLPGFLTGAISAAFSAGGPPTIVYTALMGWDKDEIKSTLTGFFLPLGVVVAVGHAMTGMTTPLVLSLYASCLPVLLLGAWLGIRLYGRFRTDGYRKVVLVFLLVMGVMMVLS